MTDTPQLLLAHHLKALKLPTFLREYDKGCRSDSIPPRPSSMNCWRRATTMTRLTRCGSRAGQNAVMHNTAFFNDVVGCYPRLQEST
jgi:hypothetical protein